MKAELFKTKRLGEPPLTKLGQSSTTQLDMGRVQKKITMLADRPSEALCGLQKVNQKHLSPLMKFILLHAGDGIEQGTVIERFYHLERRYCGYDADLCLRGKQKREYERRYRRAQPALSRALRRLQKRGLVNLVKHSSYVKEVFLTVEGKAIAQMLNTAQS